MTRTYPAVAFLVAVSTACCTPSSVEGAPGSRVVETLSGLPLAFEKNQGQTTRPADFVARGAGYSVSLSKGNARITLRRDKDRAATIDLRLVGARRDPRAAGRNTLPGKVNYFLGNDPSRWRTDIPTYERVEYTDVYRGIDLAYYGYRGRLEYDFIVAPGVNPAAIRLAADGARKVQVDANGDLVLDTDGGEVRFCRPAAYQEIAGVRRMVESNYAIAGSHEIRFTLGAHDARYPLVIDPALAYSTYLGGSGFDSAVAIAVSPGGNAFVTGWTESTDFPLVNAEQDSYGGYKAIFVSKLNVEGSGLVYSTYFGGSSNDSAYSIAVDSNGSAYIVGSTMSQDFPLKNPLYPTLNYDDADAFITKFSPAGNALVYSTYLGGSSQDNAYGVAVDAGHNAYIAGNTYSTDFPVTSGAYQTSCSPSCGFVTKVNAAGSALAWSTYFGGASGPNYGPSVLAIAVDSQDNVYLTGPTNGALPVTPGAPQPVYGGVEDAFIAKLSNTGAALTYCTYLGGSQWDSANAIAVDSAGNAYVAGWTQSTDLPVTASAFETAPGGGSDGFVAKLNSTGTQWQYLSYLGGQRYDYASGIAVDPSGNAIVAGFTYSRNFPRAAALQPILAGNQVAIFKTASAGESWSASDSGIDDLYAVNAIAIDPASDTGLLAATGGGLFQSANSGATWSLNPYLLGYLDFLAFSPAGSTAYAGLDDVVYSSSDSGATWSFAGSPPCNVTTIAVDPSSPSIVYVGGGAYGNCAGRSIDGGALWISLPSLTTLAPAVYDLALTPGSPSIPYAATGSGLFQSTDEGLAWMTAGLQNLTVTAVIVDPSQPATLYAVAAGTVFKSTDSGDSWAPASNGLTAYVNSLALAPSRPSVLYAGTPSGVFLSANSGASWSSAGLARDNVTQVAVDPQSPNTAYAVADVFADAFVAKINPAGSKLVYSTFLGGTDWDSASGVALDSSGNVFVAGGTQSPDFPSTPGAFQPATGLPRSTAFVTKIVQRTPACTYSVSPSTLFLYPAGGPANFSVVAPAGCKWTPTPSASWITVTGGTGPGVAPLGIGVAANTGTARTGTITIDSATISISQAAAGCTYLLSTNSLAFPQAGGSRSINVTAATGCEWTVTGLPLWLTATSGASGSGNGTVTLQAAPNLFPGPRPSYSFTLNVANNPVAVSQTGTSGAVTH